MTSARRLIGGALVRIGYAGLTELDFASMNPGQPLSTGHLLDQRYSIKKVLGVGGMGRVYLGNDTRLANRPVAIKEMIVGEGVQEKKAVEDFAREARVLAVLSHPGIPSLIDYFVENGRHYLVMEFVAGGDLQGMLDKLGPGGKLPEDRVLRWARQLLDVLEFLHGQSPPIVYRDLKPGNIMIGKDGRAMLIDFGIARFLPPGGRGTQIGSVGYAPPEQYMGKTEPRSDLYSLGATMHHLLTGRDPQLEPPFSFPALRALNPGVSMQTADVVMMALDKEIDKRPRDAHAMRIALPDPGPATEAEGVSAPTFRSESPLAAMKTIALPSAPPRSPTPSVPVYRSAPTPAPPAAVVVAPAPRTPVAAPRIATPSAASQMKTIVLTEPVTPTPQKPSHPVTGSKFAGEIKDKALAIMRRGIRAGLEAITPTTSEERIQPRVSSSAKTAELVSRPVSPIASPVAQPASTKPRQPVATSSRGNSNGMIKVVSADAPIEARLVARSEGLEFFMRGSRAVVGRSQDSSDKPDIDLASMGASAMRTSRHHAEIVKRGSDYFLRDLGSLNGTFVVGRGRLGRDQLYKLKERDQLVFGSAILQFRIG
ncbi:MAG TPA: protein kinase [Candidatus Binataceae bacterium]|nr:protein kinase [Candidatus Binataceae bacterium]